MTDAPAPRPSTGEAPPDLRIGVVGFGSRSTIAGLAHRPGHGSRVTVVADPAPASRERAREALGEDVALVADVEELLARHRVDAVMILTPDDTHAPVALQTLAAGIPTFCEKPMAIGIEDADAMLMAAQASGTRLTIGHTMRHMPVVRRLKAIVDSGRIGRVRAIWCRHFVGDGGEFYFKDWHAERSRSTGLLLQKGTHDIDVIHWLAGGVTRRVSGIGDLAVYGEVTDRRDNSDRVMRDWFTRDVWPPTAQKELNPIIDVEDISMISMVLDNGVLASYQQCHFTPDYWRNYTVLGDAGRVENMGDEGGDQIHIWTSRRSGPGRPDAVEVIDHGVGGHGGADADLVAAFLRGVRGGGSTDPSALAAREAVATGVCATTSIRTGGLPIDVPSAPRGRKGGA